MSVELISDQFVMEANGAGYNELSIPLPVGPSDADMMVYAFRLWYDTYAASEDTNNGWDGSDCFGLSFDDVIPNDASQENFFGWVDTNVGQNFIYSAANSNFSNQDAVLGDTSHQVMDGEGNSLGAINSDQARFMPAFGKPANPTVGALYTGLWVIKRDTGSSDKILITTGGNFESLVRLPDARLDAGTIFGETNTLLTVGASGNWRNGGGMNFPTSVVAKFTSGIAGKKFVFHSHHVQYIKYCT